METQVINYGRSNSETSVGICYLNDNSITIEFKKGGTYLYSEGCYVEEMKCLARAGDGLGSYIQKNKPPFTKTP